MWITVESMNKTLSNILGFCVSSIVLGGMYGCACHMSEYGHQVQAVPFPQVIPLLFFCGAVFTIIILVIQKAMK